jgi:hypothetical protein
LKATREIISFAENISKRCISCINTCLTPILLKYLATSQLSYPVPSSEMTVLGS